MPDPVMVSERGVRKIMEVNPAFENWIGYSREEVIDKNISELNFWASEEDIKRMYVMLQENKPIDDYYWRFHIRGDFFAKFIIQPS
jgi:PAS domain S-box-containing protein